VSGLTPRSLEPVDLLTLGETMVLLWPDGGGTLDDAPRYGRSCAGAESNLCIALSRLGHRTRWVSRLGDDPFGRFIHRTLTTENVDVLAPTVPDANTGVFFKERALQGPRRVYYYRRNSAASYMDAGDISPELIGASRMIHVTGITPALSTTCRQAVLSAIELARAARVPISFDPNVRLQIWSDEDACREGLLPILREVDIVLMGHEDAAVLFPGIHEEDILNCVLALGPTTAVLKLGDRGAIGIRGDERLQVEVYTVQVVDTIGAGDGFDAGFLAGTLRGLPFQECLDLGARVGAAAVAAEGDWEGYPYWDELGLG
jgi:2-dehydro-3-deoxygluconokinase